jgi:hypothetical protein
MAITVEVSVGELLDKITILEIKTERMTDPAKLANVRRELETLQRTWAASDYSKHDLGRHIAELKRINEALWEIEDGIRAKEAADEFDDAFIALARSVYLRNDERARVKKEINMQVGSALVEEKSYTDYRRDG